MSSSLESDSIENRQTFLYGLEPHNKLVLEVGIVVDDRKYYCFCHNSPSRHALDVKILRTCSLNVDASQDSWKANDREIIYHIVFSLRAQLGTTALRPEVRGSLFY